MRSIRWGSLATGVLGLGVVLFGGGCGRQAIATTDALPVARVVVYRNGVAYFERSGHVSDSEVRFKMKRTEVGDFLATLAVMERGGSSVRAAAVPLKVDDDNDGANPPQEPTEEQKKGLETVLLSLDGKSHELQVGYVAESPVWRPSYRLVVHADGDADLQVWGIVQNLSGEDWTNVRLSLIAGAPLAFQAELGTPVIPPRPTVTDEGEVIAAVPRAETSLNQDAPALAAPAPPPPPEAEPTADSDEAPAPSGAAATPKSADRRKKIALGSARGMAPPAAMRPAAPRPAMTPAMTGNATMSAPALSAPRNLTALAAVAVEGGSTRYDLPLPVTIPDRSATMVMLLSRTVSGEALFLFAPDGAVPDSSSHPFRVARFTNGAGGTLERGIAIDQDRKYDELGARLAKIENGELTVERDRVTQTKYRVRNGADLPAKLLVKHPRIGGARLFNPPPGTEDNVGTGSALVPVGVATHATADLVVDERATERQSTDWFGAVADAAIKAYLADPRSDRGLVQKLSAAWVTQPQIVAKSTEREKLAQESSPLSASTEETRRNLRAIEKNKTAEALRQKLTARLADAATKLDDLNRKIVEL